MTSTFIMAGKGSVEEVHQPLALHLSFTHSPWAKLVLWSRKSRNCKGAFLNSWCTHINSFTTKIEAACEVKEYFYLLIVWFVFKMGDIRIHLLSDKNRLGKRKRESRR